MIPFDVISKRSGQRRAVYAVSLHELPYFLIFRDGKWIWEESRWYEPTSEPVVHALWMFGKNPNTTDNWDYLCSACNGHYTDDTPYCPNCGAKMDGGTHGKT